jgi:2-methylisocitrate lyase-like PEP mutase family enzyme
MPFHRLTAERRKPTLRQKEPPMSSQSDRLARFRALHAPGNILVLPNAWDAASAAAADAAGAGAIATSSAAVAWTNGYGDGEKMPREVALNAARAVLRVTGLPVTVDSEAGYSADPGEVAAHVLALIEIGAAGINIEDGRGDPDLLAAKIRAIKAAARDKSADIFVNARTDVYLANLVPDDAKRAETIRRGLLYREAGADGFFPALVSDLGAIKAIADAVDLPLNVLVMKGLAPVAQLKDAGARRVSAGALIARAAYGAAALATKQMLEEGRYDATFATSGDCPDFNTLLG